MYYYEASGAIHPDKGRTHLYTTSFDTNCGAVCLNIISVFLCVLCGKLPCLIQFFSTSKQNVEILIPSGL